MYDICANKCMWMNVVYKFMHDWEKCELFILLTIQREMKKQVFNMNSDIMLSILFLHKKFIIKNTDKKTFIFLIV